MQRISHSPVGFQSTHPLRGATTRRPSRFTPQVISIHAPLAGCDQYPITIDPQKINFNPRTPCGVRHELVQSKGGGRYFNPRTPCGVRQSRRHFLICFPRFQSTHPLRGATFPSFQPLLDRVISIHAPLAGCDDEISGEHPIMAISIHAPLAGCDFAAHRHDGERRDFNPRTPCGVRLRA